MSFQKKMNSVELAGKLKRRLIWYYRHWFQRRNHIFLHSGPYPAPFRPACEFFKYETWQEIPSWMINVIVQRDGHKGLTADRQEIAQAAVMLVALVDGALAGVLFTRRGRFFKQWFVPLQKDDIVIFRVRTYPDFRGRGIAPAMMQQAMHLLLHHGLNAYVDCRVYNRPSIRCIEKAGFTRITTMKPITRQQAMGEKLHSLRKKPYEK